MPATLPRSLRGRVGWIVRECVVVAVVLVFWIGFGIAVTLLLGGLGVVLQSMHSAAFVFVSRFAADRAFLWGAVTPLAAATTSLYVLARAGTLLIDRYREAASG